MRWCPRSLARDAEAYRGSVNRSLQSGGRPVGGGLIEAVDAFFEQAARRARAESLQVPRKAVEIVKSTLGDNAGIVGAAVLAARENGA